MKPDAKLKRKLWKCAAEIMYELHPDDLNNIDHPIHRHKALAFIEAFARDAARKELTLQHGENLIPAHDRAPGRPKEDTRESLEERYGKEQVAEWIEKHNTLMAYYAANPDAPRRWAKDDPANPNRIRRKKDDDNAPPQN